MKRVPKIELFMYRSPFSFDGSTRIGLKLTVRRFDDEDNPAGGAAYMATGIKWERLEEGVPPARPFAVIAADVVHDRDIFVMVDGDGVQPFELPEEERDA